MGLLHQPARGRPRDRRRALGGRRPAVRPARPAAADRRLLAVRAGTLQVVLDKGQQDDWFSAPWIRWAVAVIAIAFVAFVIWELRTKDPVVDLRVLKNRNFAVGTFLVAVTGALASQGGEPAAAAQAVGLIYRTIVQQAATLAHVDDFRALGVLCVICIPLVLLFRKVAARGRPALAH